MSATADQPQRKLRLADANIFIDLVQAGGVGLIGDIVRFGIASIYVPRTIYDEISSEVSEVDIASLGITTLWRSQRWSALPDQLQTSTNLRKEWQRRWRANYSL